MKKFNLKEYLKNPNRKVITRDGKDVRIICTDKKGGMYPIIALCRLGNDCEICHNFLPNGNLDTRVESEFDLFFAPEKHEGWINIYNGNGYHYIGGNVPYSSKSEAIRHITKELDYVATCKIELEE